MTSRFGAVLVAAAMTVVLVAGAAQAQDAVRPEVGKPLQAAQDLIKAGKFKEALAKVHDADAAANKSAAESFTIERMRLAAASGAGDTETAAKAFEAIAASPKVTPADKLRFIESIAGSYYRAKDYPHAMQWYQRYFKEGGTNAANRNYLIQTQYLGGDFAGAARELTTEVKAAEAAGTAPAEDRLNMLLNAASKLNDNATYVYAMERLVTHYPKKEYWVDLLSRLQRKPGFSDRLALDTYRLSLATGGMSAANDYLEMAQLALQAGLPLEARQVVDEGFAAGILGTGPQAERHQRLRDLVTKKLGEDQRARPAAEKQALADKDGSALVNLGFNQVFGGQAAQGVALMDKGIAKGNLKHADDAKLHLAIAQILGGDNTKAQATLKTVAGNDGTADLARLWALYATRKR